MKKIIVILTLCVLCLMGCSNSDPNSSMTVEWNNGVISMKGDPTAITSYSGYEAIIEGGQGGLTYTFTLDNATDVTNIAVNTQQIAEENMYTHKGKFYYTEYLGSRFTMAKDLGDDNWLICQCLTNGLSADLVATYASDYMDNMYLTNSQVYVDFGDFKFGNEYDMVTARTDCALISGVAKVSIGSYDTTETISVVQGNKEYQLSKGSSSKYDYYVYGEYLIQLAAGLDISTYITFD